MNKQQGYAFARLLLFLVIFLTLGVLVMRVTPVYMKHYSVTQSIQALNRIPTSEFSNSHTTNEFMLRDKLTNQLYINGIELPKESIRIKHKKDNKYEVEINYQEKRRLIGNVSLLFDFDETREVSPRGS